VDYYFNPSFFIRLRKVGVVIEQLHVSLNRLMLGDLGKHFRVAKD
jgi:hypothetical protein